LVEPLGFEAVRAALTEDHVRDDVTTALLGTAADQPAVGTFIAEEACVVAGLPVAAEVFRQLGIREPLAPLAEDGAAVESGQPIATVRGPARQLLAGERTALNFLQRLSGIATATRAVVDAVAGTGAVVTDTRKTTPGLRDLEKYAVRMGGGENHRAHLADAILWKDNHWALLGDAELADVLARAPDGLRVVVEVESEEQFRTALDAGVSRILVDNPPPAKVKAWVRKAGKGVAIEASGGIRPETARAYAEAGARYLSIGALTHSARAIAIRFDLSSSPRTPHPALVL
jgi:nicotinate-nucleotide pyrophosphorylase (carboxylating)